jgi:uncharacterized protein (TIGR03083 family)
MDAAAHYADTRTRITELVADLPAGAIDTIAPATPLWRVRDIVSHLSGACADILDGNLDGVATDAWTAAQVDARRDLPFEQIIDEWVTLGPQVEAMMEAFPPLAATMFVTDAVTHEHDVRGAIDRPGARDSAALDFALQRMVAGLGERLDEAGAPALRLVAGNQEWVVGTGEPAATLSADGYEILRARTGRRSASQISSFAWEGDPATYVDLLPVFPARATDLIE